MGFFKVTEDVVDLFCPSSWFLPGVIDPVGAVGVFTPLQMAPKVATVIRISGNVVFHFPQCHLQKETNSTDVSYDASVVST